MLNSTSASYSKPTNTLTWTERRNISGGPGYEVDTKTSYSLKMTSSTSASLVAEGWKTLTMTSEPMPAPVPGGAMMPSGYTALLGPKPFMLNSTEGLVAPHTLSGLTDNFSLALSVFPYEQQPAAKAGAKHNFYHIVNEFTNLAVTVTHNIQTKQSKVDLRRYNPSDRRQVFELSDEGQFMSGEWVHLGSTAARQHNKARVEALGMAAHTNTVLSSPHLHPPPHPHTPTPPHPTPTQCSTLNGRS